MLSESVGFEGCWSGSTECEVHYKLKSRLAWESGVQPEHTTSCRCSHR